MRRDAAKQVQLYETVELARGELVLFAQGFEEVEIEKVGCGHDALSQKFWRRRGGIEGNLGEGIGFLKAGVVTVVAQVVKGLVGVLDGNFGDGGI